MTDAPESLARIHHPFHFLSGSELCTGAQKEHRSSPIIFPLFLFSIVSLHSTSDLRLEESSQYLDTCHLVSHVPLSGHVSRDLASELIPIFP